VLLEPRCTKAREAMKVTLLSLLGSGHLRLEQKPRLLTFLGTITHVRIARADAPTAEHEAALYRIVRDAETSGRTRMSHIVAQARDKFGSDFVRLKANMILPELIRRGLLVERKERWLGLFPRRGYAPTAEGITVRAGIQHKIGEARKLPELLNTDPKQAAAVALAAGAMILLIPELQAHYQRIGEAVHGNAGFVDGGGAGSSETGSGERPVDFGALDTNALGAVEAGAAAFDSSGGDGGGGDGGGGGD
jgi:hypothetical protein